jgi:hypothetical protein
MNVKILRNDDRDKSVPPAQLAQAELHFTDGPLAGLKLIGFAIWERRAGQRNVTYPARQYAVNGERRSFALLRPISDVTATHAIRDAILAAYAAWETSARPETPVNTILDLTETPDTPKQERTRKAVK